MSELDRVLCLLVAGLVVAGVVVEVEGQESIKMCGRDLIRHAVSYCGNSRLRRAVLALEEPQRREDPTPSRPEPDASSGPTPVPSQPGGDRGHEEDMEALVSRWLPLSARMRRTALKISDLCCEKGCSKRELIQFC